ncbi:hypothetical protein SprV_0301225300 [Sparganum proliferum]
MDGIVHSGEVNTADGRPLLVTVAEFGNPPLRISGPRIHAHIQNGMEPPERDKSEELRSYLDEVYAAVVLALGLISLLGDSHKGTRAPVIMNDLISRTCSISS